MTFREAWNAIIGPRLRKPPQVSAETVAWAERMADEIHGPIPDHEREGRRINETERQRLERISKLPR